MTTYMVNTKDPSGRSVERTTTSLLKARKMVMDSHPRSDQNKMIYRSDRNIWIQEGAVGYGFITLDKKEKIFVYSPASNWNAMYVLKRDGRLGRRFR